MQASGDPIGSALSAKDVEVMDANSNDQDDRGTSAVAAVAVAATEQEHRDDINQPENAKEQSKGETQIEIEKLENPPPSTHDHLEEEAATKLGAGDEEEEGEEENAEDDEDEEKQDKEEEEINEEASDEENDYEAQRQRNIERNQAMLRQLGLLVDSSASAMASVFGASSPTSTTSSSLPSADATLAAGFSLQTPKRKYKPRQKRNVDTPTRTSSRLQTKSRRSYAENSFFKSLPPEEQAKILADEKKARKKARQERANADAEEGEETEEQRNLRNSNKWIGSRLYDSDRGITCHQCRQKTVDEKTTCANEFRIHTPARHHYCRRCLWNRYGEALDEVRKDATWLCPSCRGVCNCSFCRKKRGQAPTGVLDTAILQKYSSVAEYLQKDRQEKPAVSEEELRKMKETIEKEIKEGIRPSVPITTSAASQAEELNSELKDDLYYVEAIVEHRSTPRGLEYLIKWLGYGYDLNTWEPAAHLNCPHLIKEYHIRNKLPLLAKRGRKKRIVDDQAPSNAEEEKKRKEKHGVDEGEAAEKEGEKEDEAEEEVEEEEEAAEEEKIAEWQTRRPGRPKGRGIGRPRLVKGTGRGPRRSSSGDDEATTATATATTTSVVDEPEANRKAGKKRKAKEPPAATSKKSGKQGKNAKRTKKDDDDDEEEEEEMDTTKKTKKMKMRKGVKAKGDRTTAVKKRGKVNKGIETKDVRKSPRRKETQKPAEREANSSARKSPRLAKRTRGGQTEDGNEKAEAKVAKATGKRKRKETRSNDGKSVDKNEDLDQEEEERAKPLYWDEPVEKGKRRRSAPILLSDDFVILGNGEVRGEAREAKKKATAKKSTTTPKARSGKAANRRAKQEEKKGEEKGENGNETKENGTGTAKDKKETEQKNKTKKKQGKGKGIGKGKEEENGQDEAADNQVEDNGDDEERPLYWETAVPGKRRRTPNMAFFSDFLFHGGPLGSKKRKKATKDH